MKRIGTVAILAVFAFSALGSVAAADWYGQYFWVVKGHDVAGTGVAQAGITPYLSAEDWIVGTPAYTGNGGPDAVRRLPNGSKAPLGRTPTERMGKVRVTLRGVGALGAEASFSPSSRLAKLDYKGKVMILLPGSRTALVDGRVVSLSDAPATRDGELFVPVRDVAEKLMGMKPDAAIRRISRAVAE